MYNSQSPANYAMVILQLDSYIAICCNQIYSRTAVVTYTASYIAIANRSIYIIYVYSCSYKLLLWLSSKQLYFNLWLGLFTTFQLYRNKNAQKCVQFKYKLKQCNDSHIFLILIQLQLLAFLFCVDETIILIAIVPPSQLAMAITSQLYQLSLS